MSLLIVGIYDDKGKNHCLASRARAGFKNHPNCTDQPLHVALRNIKLVPCKVQRAAACTAKYKTCALQTALCSLHCKINALAGILLQHCAPVQCSGWICGDLELQFDYRTVHYSAASAIFKKCIENPSVCKNMHQTYSKVHLTALWVECTKDMLQRSRALHCSWLQHLGMMNKQTNAKHQIAPKFTAVHCIIVHRDKVHLSAISVQHKIGLNAKRCSWLANSASLLVFRIILLLWSSSILGVKNALHYSF